MKNLCPMGKEFHHLRRGHNEHDNNAFRLFPITVKVQMKIL